MSGNRRALVLTGTALAALVLLGGCTGDDGGGDETPAATSSADSGDSSAKVDKDAGVTVDKADPDDVIAETTYDVPGRPGDTVRVGIESLTVHGETMELRAVFTPDLPSKAAEKTWNLSDATPDWWTPTLTDREHLKEYFVLSNTGQDWATDRVYASTTPGGSIRYQAWFAAPQDEVATMDLQFQDGWASFENVPITYEG
ncbi:hypothetical protein [Cellulomonas sp. URHE0023]|uniref:hypothetical protein n=1 Tax=Cellulomonas sp. URHE0023 TaxID=1380354 RepID=UPI000484EFA2|nr:hypothetical protein [Cellulomonas sp. URHE0023]